MRQWVVANVMQLAVQSIEVLRESVNSIPTNEYEDRARREDARFILRFLSKLTPQEVKHTVDQPALLVAATSAAIIGDRIAEVLREEKQTDKERRAIVGQYIVMEERDDMEAVNRFDNVRSRYGCLHIDFEKHKLQCHICDRFYNDLAHHVKTVHGVKIDEYRSVYGLAKDIPLKWERLIEHTRERSYTTWKGKPQVVMDEERNLVPYERTREDLTRETECSM